MVIGFSTFTWDLRYVLLDDLPPRSRLVYPPRSRLGGCIMTWFSTFTWDRSSPTEFSDLSKPPTRRATVSHGDTGEHRTLRTTSSAAAGAEDCGGGGRAGAETERNQRPIPANPTQW